VSLATIILAVAAIVVAASLVVWRERVREMARSTSVFVGEVQNEVKKVTWPDREQLRNATGVIILFVVIVAILIGLMDVILQGILVKWLPAWLR
jgi:preprotein translocase subunit SecE